MCHTSNLRHQLIQFLENGSEYFIPEEVRRIIRAVRFGPKGSLNAINMLEEDMQLFMHEFPNAEKGELREQCRNKYRLRVRGIDAGVGGDEGHR